MIASAPPEQRLAAGLDRILALIGRRWLFATNLAVGLFLLGAIAAPLLAAAGADGLAGGLYAAYHAACHQWPFRSFFLFGPQAVYSADQLLALGVDPYTFAGGAATGWKMAFCERDLAIYLGLLAFGLFYARRLRATGPMPFRLYALAIAPLALDGLTQLVGGRESTWQLRLVTGALFGLASGWLLYPRLDQALGWRPSA
jgi:uncharacterized membrane protein